MPISIDQFENTSADAGELTNAERVLRFLAANDGQAFTRSEIAARTDVARNSVGPTLSRLDERGLVRHRGRYWAIAAAGLESTAIATTEREECSDSESGPASRTHRDAATAFADRAQDRLDGAIDALYLFGSVARDAESATSDVDILAVIGEEADYGATDDELLDVAFDIQLEYGIVVEMHSIRAPEFHEREARGEPFVRTVRTEGERYV